MNEAAARDVTLVRAVETTDRDRALWSDADRAWAGRAALEVVGTTATPDGFLARRAALALERLRERHTAVAGLLRAATWRPWVGVVLVVAAFALGLATDQIGPAKRVNVLAFPLLALLLWNLLVYAAIALSPLVKLAGRRGPGPIRRTVARLGSGMSRAGRGGALTAASAAFATDWAQRSAPLLGTRVARVLHLAAVAFAAGAVAGLYLRGLVFEYRAGWESTFLDAETVQALLAFALAPGSALTGIAVPDASRLDAIRFAAGGTGENAAPWIHLYAATVAIIVLVPRALLAAGAWIAERRLTRRFPLPLDDAYIQRLLREFSDGPMRVRVVPYSYQVPDGSLRGLEAALARACGGRAEVSLAPPVAWGAEDALPADALPVDPLGLAVALFNLIATPEGENHGAFLAALAARLAPGGTLVVVIDEAGFRKRFAGQQGRLDERRAAWREMLASRGHEPVFVDLNEPDLAAAEAALHASLERRGHE